MSPHTDNTGDHRWRGPTADELLGQRATRHTSTELTEPVAKTAAETIPVPELPELDAEVYLLDPDASGGRARRTAVHEPLQGLALDTALSAGGDVVWVDAQGHATTHSFASIAPSKRALDRVHVARAFTTHQHHTLVEQVGRWIRGEPDGPFGTPETDTPAVVVCPAIDALYRGGDLPRSQAQTMLLRSLAVLQSLARASSIPVVLTRTREDEFTDPLAASTTTISLEETDFGARFVCDKLDFETLAYPVGHGQLQTTLAFWKDILASRHPAVAPRNQAAESTPSEPATPGTLEG